MSQCAALWFVLKGFRLWLVHKVFKHNFINSKPVERRQSGRQFPVLQLLQEFPLSTETVDLFYRSRWNVKVITDVRPLDRDAGGLCVLWTLCQVEEGGGVSDKMCIMTFFSVGGQGLDSTSSCVKLSSMLLNHA